MTSSAPPLPKYLEAFVDTPYGGLFGDTVIAHVVEEMVASPSVAYRPTDLQELTGKGETRVRSALATLIKLDLIVNVSDDPQHPRYRVKTHSKKFVALSFLAYAMLDDRDGSDCMDTAVHDYHQKYVREKFEPFVISSGRTGTRYGVTSMKEKSDLYGTRIETGSLRYLRETT